MSKELFISLLNPQFYNEIKTEIDTSFFPKDISYLYKVIEQGYEQGIEEWKEQEFKYLYNQIYPHHSQSKKQLAYVLIEEVCRAEPIGLNASRLAYKNALVTKKADAAATLLMDTHQALDIDKVRELLTEIEALESGKEDVEFIDFSVESLLEKTKLTYRWKFNLPSLIELVPGIGDGTVTILGARPNIGKSGSCVFFCFGPGGFAEQGAKILYLCNEEKGEHTGLRAVICNTGMVADEIALEPALANSKFSGIKSKVMCIDDVSMTMSKLHKICKKYKPDIVVIDQLDHIKISGNFSSEHLKLGAIYRAARELAKTLPCAVIGVSQASADAEGKLHYGMDCLANSKTEKAATGDLVLLLGANPMDDNGLYSNLRCFNVGKNKITGKHGPAMCVIQPELTRFVL